MAEDVATDRPEPQNVKYRSPVLDEAVATMSREDLADLELTDYEPSEAAKNGADDAPPTEDAEPEGAEEQAPAEEAKPVGDAKAEPGAAEPEAGTEQEETGEDTKAADDDVRIPKGRFDEVIAQRDKAREEAAYERGRREALEAQRGDAGAKPGTQDTTRSQPEADTIESLDAELLSLAQRYDDGDVSTVEYEKGRLALMDRRSEVKARQTSRAGTAQEDRSAGEHQFSLAYDEAEQQVLGSYEGLDKLTNADRAYLEQKAIADAQSNGIDLTSERGALYCVRRYHEIGAQMGLLREKKGTAPAAKPQAAKPVLGKEEIQKAQPPSLSGLPGHAATTAGQDLTPEQAAQLPAGDIAKLPKQVLNRLAEGAGDY